MLCVKPTSIFWGLLLLVDFSLFGSVISPEEPKHRDGAKMKQLLLQKGGPFTKTNTDGLSQTITGGNTSFYAYST